MSAPDTYDDVLDEMYGNREALVQALHFFNGEANRQEIRKHGDIPKGSMHDLCTTMEEWDVIEHVGKEPVGRGGRADVYQFTDLGRAISEPVVDDSTTVDEVVEHEERIDELEDQIESLKEMYSEMSTVLDALKNDLGIEVDESERGR
jgi:hypothetical protein